MFEELHDDRASQKTLSNEGVLKYYKFCHRAIGRFDYPADGDDRV